MIEGNSSKLTDNEKVSIETVLNYYLQYNTQQLMDVIKKEGPWLLAYMNKENKEITYDSIIKYYERGDEN